MVNIALSEDLTNSKITFKTTNFNDLSKDELKKLKQLCIHMTGERLIYLENNEVIICYYNKKIIAMCAISPFSPERHFPNDDNAVYLYNFICDVNYRKYKNSYKLMNYIKSHIKHKFINLDVLENNGRAKRFFEKNGFKQIGTYTQKINDAEKKYLCFTFEF